MRDSFGDVTGEYLALRESAGLVEDAHEVVWVRGPDSLAFLDSLLSQDLAAIPHSGVGRSLLLTPQGKLRAHVWVLRDDSELGLVADTGLSEDVAADLSRFKIRVDADIELDERPLYELWGPASGAVLRDVGLPAPDGWVREGEVVVARFDLAGLARFLVVGVSSDRLLEAGARAAGNLAVTAVRVEAGEARVGRDLDEKTIPQETGLVTEAVAFDKGCFLGQELVARLDARGGRVNRHLWGVVIGVNTLPPEGAAVFRGDREVGKLSSVAESLAMRSPVALAMLWREVAPGDELVVKWEGGEAPAQAVELPMERHAGLENAAVP